MSWFTRARLDLLRIPDQQRHVQRLLVHPALVEPAVLAQIEALVGGVDHDRVVGQARLLEVIQHPAHAVIDRRDAGQVVVHVPLILPADQVLALEIGLLEGLDLGPVGGVPLGLLLRRQTGRRRELDVLIVHGLGDGHVLLMGRPAPAGIVVEQRRRLRDLLVVVERQVLRRRLPLAVRGLVVHHQKERLVPLSLP